MDNVCPQCSGGLIAGTRFCGQCGFDRESPVARKKKQRTMLGLPASQLPSPPNNLDDGPPTMADLPSPEAAPAPGPSGFSPVAAPPSSPPAALAKHAQRTMMGMLTPAVPPADPALGDTGIAVPASRPAESKSPPTRKSANRTMMGMAQHRGAPTPAASQAYTASPGLAPAPQPAAASSKKRKAANRTMMGMPAVAPQQPRSKPAAQAPRADPPQVAAVPAQVAAAPAQKGAPAAQTNRTMLGVAVKPPAAAPGAQTNRTMLGMKATGPASIAQTDRTMMGQQAVAGAGDYGPDAHVQEELPSKRGGAAKPVAVVLLIGALIAGGVFAGLYFMRGPDVVAAIATSGTGEVLRLEVPGAEAGTKVRFQGQELPLENGRAEFPVGADALQIGDNELSVDVVSPSGDVSAATLLLQVAYRVRPDLSALEGDDPKVRIVIDAVVGSTFALDETAVALDASGHGFAEFELESATGSTFERTFHYRIVKPDGAAEEGEVTVSIPMTALQIARPSSSAVTDRDRIEIAGAVHDEATVSVNGTAVATSEGRFVTTVPLPTVGEHLVNVIARREGRAPRALELSLRRVESLSVEAQGFGADASLTYVRVAAAVSTYQGQKVSFVGRVFNAGESTDGPMMQVVVRECPRAQRCPLWINYDGAVPIELNQWVRVYGTLNGEQQYRTADGNVGQSPRMHATIVIPEPVR